MWIATAAAWSCVSLRSHQSETRRCSSITVIITTTVFMLPSGNCQKQEQKKTPRPQRRSPTASTHPIIRLSLSLRFPVLSSIRRSSFLCRFSLIHHLVSQSLIPSSCLYLSLPWYHQRFLPHFVLFFTLFLLLNTVFSRLLSPSVCCCCCCLLRAVVVYRPCFNVTQLASCHPWPPDGGCMCEIWTCTRFFSCSVY